MSCLIVYDNYPSLLMASGCVRDSTKSRADSASLLPNSKKNKVDSDNSMAGTSYLGRCPAAAALASLGLVHCRRFSDEFDDGFQLNLHHEDSDDDDGGGTTESDPEVERANEVWNEFYFDTTTDEELFQHKDRFGQEIICNIFEFEDDEDSRAARKGTWEADMLDRQRFLDRIRNTEEVLAPIFAKEHREKVYTRLYKSSIDSEKEISNNLPANEAPLSTTQ